MAEEYEETLFYIAALLVIEKAARELERVLVGDSRD